MAIQFKPFSKKQLATLTWWCAPKTAHCDGIICDGAVRSGKTLCMSLSFVSWAMATSDGETYAICGKTITSLKRNVITPLVETLLELGFICELKHTGNYIDISFKGRKNRFHLFGGKDEGSASLIQGITLAGVMLDEVALMPRSFVEQALARCSRSGSKMWFNCNPEHPYHWFYLEWVKKCDEKNTLYLHFTMADNPSLSPAIVKRYNSLYSGVFHERFILGKWAVATGLVYPMFNKKRHVITDLPRCDRFFISCDYGTVNPSSFGLWGQHNAKWYRLREYYYDSKIGGVLRTDEEHYSKLCELAGDIEIEAVVVDPSAASFMECIRRHGKFKVIPAKNEVISGIRRVSESLRSGELKFSNECKDTIREFSLYCWDDSCNDTPKKENDHAMDDVRYFVSTILSERGDDFFVLSASRKKHY